jgi:hypothetical protein
VFPKDGGGEHGVEKCTEKPSVKRQIRNRDGWVEESQDSYID